MKPIKLILASLAIMSISMLSSCKNLLPNKPTIPSDTKDLDISNKLLDFSIW